MHCFRKRSLSCLSQLRKTQALSVDRLLGDLIVTSKVLCDCLKVGLDFVSTDSVGVSYNCDKHDSDLLTHVVHSAPCSNLYKDNCDAARGFTGMNHSRM